jgi:tetratricopeptide (TPR) repeat protein
MIKVVVPLVLSLLALKSFHRCTEWSTELSLFESALDVCPTSLKVLNNLALKLLDKEGAQRAGELLDTAIAIHPDYPSALFNRGLVSYIKQDWESAADFIEQSLEFDNVNAKAYAYLSQAKLTIAFEMQKEGRWEAAKTTLTQALTSSDVAIQQGCTLPLAYHVRCQVGHELGLGEESLWFCQRAIEINQEKIRKGDPENELIMEENTHNAQALIYRAANKMQEAVHFYELGLAVNPDCFEILVNMGGLLTDMGHQKEAMEFYGRALEKSPDSPELITNIGWLLELQGYLEDARDHYARALELLKPYSHPQIVNNLANVKSRIDQISRARQEQQETQERVAAQQEQEQEQELEEQYY